MLALFVPALCASVLAAAGCQQDGPVGVGARPQAEVMQQRDTSLVPIADTYVRQGSPNQNQGAELILRLQSSGKNRALLRRDQQVLAQAATGGTLVAARLELTIADLADNWSAAGRTVDLHRLTHTWTELGATWNCAVDSVPGNSRADCAGATAWDMDHSASYSVGSGADGHRAAAERSDGRGHFRRDGGHAGVAGGAAAELRVDTERDR